MNALRRLAAAVEEAAIDLPFVAASGAVREVAPAAYRVRGLSALARLGDRVALGDGEAATVGEIVRVDETGATVKPFDGRASVGIGMRAQMIGAMRLSPAPSWKGRVVNALGEPVDGAGPLARGERAMPTDAQPPPAMVRQRIRKALRTGVRLIDLFTPFCEGQ
ncbi:MAG: flagellum-specific ATP synthase FliI, partial [Rhizobiales bacterium]|nr:flagellum-specific ATP synthase FliI [Hyphomicrobiales bacterium]